MSRNFSKLPRIIGVVLCLSLLSAPLALAQSQASTGIISGTVQDQSGGVLPGATVTLTQNETGFERIVITDDEGRFRARLLPVGPYTLYAEVAGFKKHSQSLRLTIGATLSVRVILQVGDISEIVTVSADSTPLVETTSNLPQAMVGEKAITDLPINGRDFQSFIFLTPGAVQAGRNTVSLGGQKGIQTNFNIDGADRNNPFFGGQSGGDRPPFTFSQEAIREFVVLKDGFSAEFGRSTAGIVNVVTKSGTNDWHGSAFFLYQDNSFIADEIRRSFNAAGSFSENRLVAPDGDRYQYGGSFGGPIVRDRAFFFFSTEHQNFSRPLFVVFDFTAAERLITPPEILALEGTFSSTDEAHIYLIKGDFTANDSNNFSIRYTLSQSEQVNGTSTGTTDHSVDNNGLEIADTDNIVASWNAIVTPRLVNEFRFNWNKEDRPREANVNFETSEVRIGNEADLGGVWFLPIPETDDRFQFVDNASYNFGSHDLKFGVEYNNTGVDQNFFGNGRGTYRFDDIVTFNNDIPNRYTQRFGTGLFDDRVSEWAFYVQDEIKISPRLTVNAGLRWEGQYNPDQKIPNTDFPRYAEKIVDDTNNWAPRVGFAWDVSGEGKSVLKASAGIFHGRTPMLLYSNPLVVNGDVTADVEIDVRDFSGAPVVPINRGGGAEGVPGYTAVWSSLQEAADFAGITLPSSGTFPGADVNLHDLDYQNPESYRYTVSFEQELAPDWVASVSYTHSDSKFRQRRRDLNLFPGVADNTGRTIFPSGGPADSLTTGRILLVESTAVSDFDQLTFSIQKRFSDRFQMQAFYSYSDNKGDDDNERSAGSIQNSDPDNLRELDYGRSSIDITHNFTFNGVLELPWGFQLSGIVNAHSGFPWNTTTGNDDNNDGNRSDRPLAVDVLAALPGASNEGAAGGTQVIQRNALENPKAVNVDMRFTKEFVFGDNARISGFFEFFNLFNHRAFTVSEGRCDSRNDIPCSRRTGYGQPSNQSSDPRSFQLGVRFDF